jgi:uncharacterized membrane protein
MPASRLEAFSDGVFAIVVTLLVLDLRGPRADTESIAHTLSSQGYTIAAYVVAFLVVGVLWMNHHSMFRIVGQVDRIVLFTNLVLLMLVSATPYTASLFADGLQRGGFDAKVGAAAFSTVFTVLGFVYSGLWVALTRESTLADDLDHTLARRRILRFGAGNIVYLALIGLSFVAPLAVLTLQGIVAVYYAFDQIPANAYRREEVPPS